jgi:hypothetical protein
MTFDIGKNYVKISGYFNFHFQRTRLKSDLHEGQHAFLHLSQQVFISEKFSSNRCRNKLNIVTDLINGLPGNSSVNTVQYATIDEAVFSIDPTDEPIDWLDSDHVISVYCGSMSVPRLYK